ncbi:hypothetical protein SDC9_167118 [bioreactor metagenome]|uniref:Uncharacterized protein n=1 Tax=bioreactor metagenome TaxID=1076179 RepID=A0A645G0T1_9ZZZZ
MKIKPNWLSVDLGDHVSGLHPGSLRGGTLVHLVDRGHKVAKGRERHKRKQDCKHEVCNRPCEDDDDSLPNLLCIKASFVDNVLVFSLKAAHTADGKRTKGKLRPVFIFLFQQLGTHADGEFQNRKPKRASCKIVSKLVNHHKQREQQQRR